MRIFLLTIFIISIASFTTRAAHIIGGEITYECLGGDQYRFTMRIYRDCASGGAQFDGPGASIDAASITIFRGSAEYDRLYLGAPTVTSIEPNLDNPCLIFPPGICVEEGVYVFTETLPASNQTYTVTYQRCCRNNTISNLIEPGTSGATYTVEVSPDAQNSCNNSPTFNNFPPIVICAGNPIDFDHSASDPEGDQLVYELCTPFLGGGTAGTDPGSGPNAAFLPNGVAPDPDSAPPYDPVNFVVPAYSASSPMAGDPVVTINPNTGLITGVPTTVGQFVVGVCVKEFRNGVLLSTVRRDFQFNVTSCTPTVEADIREDFELADKEFVVNACGNNTVVFENESVQEQFIDEFSWEFYINGTTEVFNEWNAEVTFPSEGTYEGRLFLNPETDCGDTAIIFVNVYPEINSEFTYDYDTCVAGAVSFLDESFSGSGFLTDWFWDFGDGAISEEVNPEHLYGSPGMKSVALTVRDTNDCEETRVQDIFWVPAPAEVIVEPSSFVGCTPAELFFNNLSSPIDDTYDILWDFGDGTSSSEISPTHTYEEPGVYSVTLDIVSPIGCAIGATYPNWITIRQSPEADFTYSPQNPSNLRPEVTYTDQSERAVAWQWFFGEEGFTTEQNPIYTFPDTGYQEVIQVAIHENGCQDTARILLDVEPIVTYYLPNAFTPNSDSNNDFFLGNGIFEGMTDFEMTIWNRWGEKVFATNDPNEAWNGRKNNDGRMSPNGVYVVLVNYKNPRKKTINLKGYATLIN